MSPESKQSASQEQIGVSLRGLLKLMSISENRFLRDFVAPEEVNLDYLFRGAISRESANSVYLAVKGEEIAEDDLKKLLVSSRKKKISYDL